MLQGLWHSFSTGLFGTDSLTKYHEYIILEVTCGIQYLQSFGVTIEQ